MTFDLSHAWLLAVALLGGLAVGIEREWSGKATGPRAHFGGVRTFSLLGLISGLSGWLWTAGLTGPSVVLLAGAGGLVVLAYYAASRHDVDGTTEVAAIVVLSAGVLAGSGALRLASAIIAVTVLLLIEKKRLHGLVSKLDRVEMRAGARFAVMAAVILPLLPEGPFGPFGGVRPRMLWALVLFFSALSFVGYLARRSGAGHRGYALAGALGGILSSTSVTLTFSRLSAQHESAGRALAAGAIGANVVLLPRVAITSMVLAPMLASSLWPALLLPAALGVVLFITGIRDPGKAGQIDKERNPLQVMAALQMAALFQVVLFVATYARAHFGDMGLFGTAALLGLVDMDALTLSMSQMATSGTAPDLAANALLVGLISNTVVKLGITVAVGRGRFRVLTAVGLVLMGAAMAAALAWRMQSVAGLRIGQP